MLDALGQYSLYFGILLTLLVFINHWKFSKSKLAKRNFQLNIAAMVLLWISYIVLIIAFIQKDYRFVIVYNYSDNSMSVIERAMAAWAQRQGVMILWSALTTSLAVFVYWYLRNNLSNPYVSRAVSVVLFFSALIAIFAASPRNPTAFEQGIDHSNGLGLDPSLLSFWQEIHPPIAFLAYSAFIVPYAVGLATLSIKSDFDKSKLYWMNDIFMLLGWGLTSIFVIAGSLWGYEENWSGFWAWDAVEVAAFVMWFVATLYFHAKSHVPAEHPLRSVLAALGWVSVVFSAFIVRSGLLEGLHTYAKSTENLILSFVFGFLLIGSALGVIFAIYGFNISKQKFVRRHPEDTILPDFLYEWKKSTNKVKLATFWLIVFGAAVNVVGLILQIVNAVIWDRDNIPYDYYIVFNGMTLFTLVILLGICELRNHDWTNNAKIILFGISGLIIIPPLYFTIGHNISNFVFTAILSTIVLSLIINLGRTIYTKKKLRKISISIVHITIILMIVSYFAVDFSSRSDQVTLYLGQENEVDKFDMKLNMTDYNSGRLLEFIIEVTFDGGESHTISLTHGKYKGQDWSRGDWIIFPLMDYFFHIDGPEQIGGFGPNVPLPVKVLEKPIASIFRITFGLLIVVTVIGLYSIIKRRPAGSEIKIL
ncbi:MAG: cytochrome c biogenesis protein CcsA [Candidatus Kariarchaeaceae archaeon]|jgi:cytochrome c-type biogenesis protein CcmF